MGVHIKDGHTYLNLIAIMLLPFLANSLNLDILSTTVQLLEDKDYFNIKENLSSVSSNLNFYCVPAQMVMVLFAGFTYDIFGRRITIFLSLVLCSICAFFMPYTSPHIYPWLLITKLLCTMSIQPCFSHPLINDYII